MDSSKSQRGIDYVAMIIINPVSSYSQVMYPTDWATGAWLYIFKELMSFLSKCHVLHISMVNEYSQYISRITYISSSWIIRMCHTLYR